MNVVGSWDESGTVPQHDNHCNVDLSVGLVVETEARSIVGSVVGSVLKSVDASVVGSAVHSVAGSAMLPLVEVGYEARKLLRLIEQVDS